MTIHIIIILIIGVLTIFIPDISSTIFAQQSTNIENQTAATAQNQKNLKFNIAVASDWRCDENAQATAKNIRSKDPELVIAGGDVSYKKSVSC